MTGILRTVIPVPAHTHNTLHCKVCDGHLAKEMALLMAASLCYLTNVVGDQHRELTGKGNGHAHALARMAWEALGKPDRETVNEICAGAEGWDGVQNHGFDWWREARCDETAHYRCEG